METGIIALIITTAATLVGLIAKLAYSSKCTHVKCCCLEIQRDPRDETAINIDSTTGNGSSKEIKL